MTTFSLPIQLRWSDFDANRHLRHSTYYDYGAWARMVLLRQAGLSTKELEQLQLGPILFREEAVFKREIVLEDTITIDVELTKATRDFGRWSMRHHLYKNEITVASIITVDGAWIDLSARKLAKPNELIQEIYKNIPASSDFAWIESTPK